MQVGRCSARLKITRARGQRLRRRRRRCGRGEARGPAGTASRPAPTPPLNGASPRGHARTARASRSAPRHQGRARGSPACVGPDRAPGKEAAHGPRRPAGEEWEAPGLSPAGYSSAVAEGQRGSGFPGARTSLPHLPAGGGRAARLGAPPTQAAPSRSLSRTSLSVPAAQPLHTLLRVL